ncbi:MFS transporter [Defluviimonas sp. WL0002]|uniref:MFS transporter n=1 Tax=Albidovulum marisflavi TaxID=2984159 RepID=A0ABT2ZAU7_9RHOB|nr:MFS transporter [Defluviimonas sp. WL0002]MCV2868253.1 MFS transporter [Defluviimonas sp. WL0002]
MQAADGEYVTWAEVLRGRYAASVLLCCLGVWLHAADALVVTTMMPAIVADIGGDRIVAWNFALYDTGSIVAGAATGLVALRLGIRGPMIAAALLFAAGCLLSAVAPTMPVLLAGRVAQGLGGGGLVSLSFVAVARIFPVRMMPRAFAAMSVVWGASAFAGPLVGGVFVTWGSWRAGFVAFALQAALLAVWFRFGIGDGAAPKGQDDAAGLPMRRLALLCAAVLSVAFAGIAGSVALMSLFLALGVGALALFAWLDNRSGADRLWPRRAFDLRHPTGAALVMILAMNISTMGLATYGPLLMDLIHGTKPLVAGYIVAIISIAWTVSAVVVSGQPQRRDPMFIMAGMTLVLLSVMGLFHAVPRGPVWLIAVFAACEGIGYGMAWSFIVRRAGRLAVGEDTDRMTAALPTIGRLGYALGASTMGIFANSAGFDASASAPDAAQVARTIFLGSIPFAALGWVAMLRFTTFGGSRGV